MSCYSTPCTCPTPCPPTPCTDGCLMDLSTDCIQLASDLTVCADTLLLGSSLTAALEDIAGKVCDALDITVLDIKSKVSANDTTTDYLEEKLKPTGATFNTINITKANPGGDEELRFSTRLSTSTGDNRITVLTDGLYVAPQAASTITVDTDSTDTMTLVSSLAGSTFTLEGNVRIDPDNTNILESSVDGLYVPPFPATTTLTIAGSNNNTNSIHNAISLTGSTYNVLSTLQLDPASTATVAITSNGLKVDMPTTGNTLIVPLNTYSIETNATAITGGYNISSDVIIKPGANALVETSTGLYVAPPTLSFSVADTNSVDMVLTGSVVTSNLKYQNLSARTVTLDVPDASGLTAAVRISSATPNNLLGAAADGLYATLGTSGTCPALTISDLTFNLVQDLEGEMFLRTTPLVSLSGDTIRLKITYTKLGGTSINSNITYIIPSYHSGTAGLSLSHLPDFDLNNNQTVTIDASRNCSINYSTLTSVDYNTTVAYTAPTYDYDTWINIPAGWYATNASAGTIQPQFKITKDKKHCYFRGTIATTSTLAQIPTGGFTSLTTCNLINTTVGSPTLSSLLDSSVSLSSYGVVTHSINDDTSTFTSKIKLQSHSTAIAIEIDATNTSGSTVQVSDVYISGISFH